MYLPTTGIVEFNLAAVNGRRYGIIFGDIRPTFLEFDTSEQKVKICHNGTVISEKALYPGFAHAALHSIRIAYRDNAAVYIDNLMMFTADISLGGCSVHYFSDGELKIGSCCAQSYNSVDLHYPVPCIAPAEEKFRFDTDVPGRYQFLITRCGNPHEILVDKVPLLPDEVDRGNHLAYYSCLLELGTHTVDARVSGAQDIMIAPHYGSGVDNVSVAELGPFDKVCGGQKWTNTRIYAKLAFTAMAENGEAGILFRSTQLADGGEGTDKVLGTDFFVGYRVAVSDSKIRLWKHRYNAELLCETEWKWNGAASLEILAAGNTITVRVEDSLVLSYRDPWPILYGYNGFHAKNCIIKQGLIEEDSHI